jgi:uncharacterized protein YbaP (TraB family)
MKKIIAFSFLFISLANFSQEKYQGLLWEISGNGLTKKSYLYGTMHVSGRIAYHLGEEFFNGLKEVDAIALESNPIIWLDEIVNSKYADGYLGAYGIKHQTYNGFYKEAFKITVPDSKEIGNSLSANHYLTNWMLYRENRGNADFEEETFLDMFIYQAGSKNNKPIYSLEDFKQTTIFSKLSQVPDAEKKEMSAWYEEITKDKRYFEVLQDSYRSQDLDLMDSLQKEVSSSNHLKYMLYDRNIIMAQNIDSIIQSNTSLFIGIGAAHLPKAKGVIGLLRNKGYTVHPITPTVNDKAKQEKLAYGKQKRALPYKNDFSSELFSLKLPSKVYETPSYAYQRQFFAPELTNGTFYTVTQISTYAYLKGLSNRNYLVKVDSLLFENIPGTILEKNEIEKNGFKGLDIINKTKSGDYQHYQLFFTPINIFIFKMGGKNEFVKDDGANFFSSIKLNGFAENWKEVSTIKNDFTVNIPGYYSIKNNNKITSLYGHPEIEAYDITDSSYYLVKRASLQDLEFIEVDEFELKRLMDKFCKELDVDSMYSKEIIKGAKYPTGVGYVKTSEDKNLHLKVVIKGAYYYLLASVSNNKKPNSTFFDSFKINEFEYNFDFYNKIDSTLNFEVNSNYLSPNVYEQMVTKAYEVRRDKNDTQDKAYLGDRKSESYYSENHEKISVEYQKYHRYKQYDNIDSVWSEETRYFQRSGEFILKEKRKTKKDSLYILDAVFTDTNSARSIVKKYILAQGVLYTLTANLDTLSKKSKYAENFFETFTPKLTEKYISVLDDKAIMFFDALNGKDSLETERALKSVSNYIIFADKDVDKLIDVIKNYNFPIRHIDAKAQLIQDLGKLSSPKILPFLTSSYSGFEQTALFQIAVLKALAKQKNKNASKQLLALLDNDIPLSGNKWETGAIFIPYSDTLKLMKELFPAVLNFTFVSDYKDPIYEMLGTALDSNIVKAKNYKKYYAQILREAKIELKMQISLEQSEEARESEQSYYYYSSYKNRGNRTLIKYITMLIPFHDKKDVKEFFTKLTRVQDYEVQTDLAIKKILNDVDVDKNTWVFLADDIINVTYLYNKLEKIDRVDLFPVAFKNQELFSKSILYRSGFNFAKDSIEFIEKRIVTTKKEDGYVYFFKSKKKKADKWSIDYVGIQPTDTAKVNLDESVQESGVTILKGKDISEIIDEEIKKIEIIGHKRAVEDEFSNFNNFF